MKRCHAKKILFFLVGIFVLLSGFTSSSMNGSESFSHEEIMARQEKAVNANECLMQYFRNEGYQGEYPEYYFGTYITDNILNVCLYHPSESEKDNLRELLKDYLDFVRFQEVKFSRKETTDYADRIVEELEEMGFSVVYWAVNVKTQNIQIDISEEDYPTVMSMVEEYSLFSTDGTMPEVILDSSPEIILDVLEVVGGDMISSGGSVFSAAACGTYNGSKAMITCGHGGLAENDIIKKDGKEIGIVSKVQYEDGENGDFSIICLNNDVEVTHKIGNEKLGYTVISDGVVLSPTPGMCLTKYGAKSGYAYVEICEENVRVNMAGTRGKSVKGLVKAKIVEGKTTNGDSGGPYLFSNPRWKQTLATGWMGDLMAWRVLCG